MTTRAERAAEAARLRAEGLIYKDIAARIGTSVSYAQELVTDPDGSGALARKARLYSFECSGCGKTIVANGTKELANRTGYCQPCLGARERGMSRRWILESMAEWEDRFGVPPTATDWNPQAAYAKSVAWKAQRLADTDRPWPSVSSVQAIFGSWNAALQAAGYDTFEPGYYGREGEYVSTDEIHALYEAGLSGSQIADRFGISSRTVYDRLRKAGLPVRSRVEGRQLRREMAVAA